MPPLAARDYHSTHFATIGKALNHMSAVAAVAFTQREQRDLDNYEYYAAIEPVILVTVSSFQGGGADIVILELVIA